MPVTSVTNAKSSMKSMVFWLTNVTGRKVTSVTSVTSRTGPALLDGRFLDAFHVLVGQPEMMADLVDQHMGDDVAQRLLVLRPVVEDGAAVERDAVRPLAGLGVPALGEAASLEQAEQIERRLQGEVVHDLVGRELGDQDDDLAGELAEVIRQMRIGLQREQLHLFDR